MVDIGDVGVWKSPTHVDPIIGHVVDIYPEESEVKLKQGDGTTVWAPHDEVTRWLP